jgi:hypothetical protein
MPPAIPPSQQSKGLDPGRMLGSPSTSGSQNPSSAIHGLIPRMLRQLTKCGHFCWIMLPLQAPAKQPTIAHLPRRLIQNKECRDNGISFFSKERHN